MKRWQVVIKLAAATGFKDKFSFVRYKTNRRLTTFGHKNIRGLRRLYKNPLVPFYSKKIHTTPYMFFDYDSTERPYREFMWAKNLYNHVHAFLNTQLSYPGFKLYPFMHIAERPDLFINQIVPVSELPINSVISFVFNNSNYSMTYARSSGASAAKRKDSKKYKLVYIELPSGTLRLFPSYTNCVLSAGKNLYLNKIVEGGWGYFVKSKKHIVVRGVAMNPVDHPNGGRTKAKQPEMSPWGWIAKKNK